MEAETRTIIRKNGTKYTIRQDRRRYFFPDEWNKFIKTITKKEHELMFLTLLHTGARIMEALHLKPKDLDIERGAITFRVIKQRKAKRQFYSLGKTRTFFISPILMDKAKKYFVAKKIQADEYIFLDNEKLPENYDDMANKEKRPYFEKYKVKYSQLLKRKLKKAGIKDYYNFSLHNIRKTYGNWMRIFDIRNEELCYRMGHDLKTYFEHYGSAIIFTPQERIEIQKILGEVR